MEVLGVRLILLDLEHTVQTKALDLVLQNTAFLDALNRSMQEKNSHLDLDRTHLVCRRKDQLIHWEEEHLNVFVMHLLDLEHMKSVTPPSADLLNTHWVVAQRTELKQVDLLDHKRMK